MLNLIPIPLSKSKYFAVWFCPVLYLYCIIRPSAFIKHKTRCIDLNECSAIQSSTNQLGRLCTVIALFNVIGLAKFATDVLICNTFFDQHWYLDNIYCSVSPNISNEFIAMWIYWDRSFLYIVGNRWFQCYLKYVTGTTLILGGSFCDIHNQNMELEKNCVFMRIFTHSLRNYMRICWSTDCISY